MKTTIAQLARLFTAAANKGLGGMELQLHLYASDELKQAMEPDTGPITHVPVARDATGRWLHPCCPAEWTVPMGTWLRERGFDFTVTYLLKPDDYSPDDIANCQLVPPMHKGRSGAWFCWEINTNADGEAVAVWIAPTE